MKYIKVYHTDFMISKDDEGKARLNLFPSLTEELKTIFPAPLMIWHYICILLFALQTTNHLIPYDMKLLSLRFGCSKEDIEKTLSFCLKNKLAEMIEAPFFMPNFRQEFERIWSYFISSAEKPRCYKLFLQSVKKPEDFRNIQIALSNYFNAKYHIPTKRLRKSDKYFRSVHRPRPPFKSLGSRSISHTPLFFFKYWKELVVDKKTHKSSPLESANRIRRLGWIKNRDLIRKALLLFREEHLTTS